jgi:hypothetical protein
MASPASSTMRNNTRPKTCKGVRRDASPVLAFLLCVAANLSAQSQRPSNPQTRRAAEYYVSVYARHYHVPVPLVRAIVQRESNWQPCAVSLAAGYYAGEDIVARRGLSYHNRDVVSYVARIRATYVFEAGVADDPEKNTSKRVMR